MWFLMTTYPFRFLTRRKIWIKTIVCQKQVPLQGFRSSLLSFLSPVLSVFFHYFECFFACL